MAVYTLLRRSLWSLPPVPVLLLLLMGIDTSRELERPVALNSLDRKKNPAQDIQKADAGGKPFYSK
jgi:hypothetical protein